MEPNHLGTLLYFSSETLCSSNLSEVREHIRTMYMVELKGILPQNSFYRPNLKFWIVMGCGKARFGRKGQKNTKIWKFWSQSLFPGTLRRPAHETLRHPMIGPRGNPHTDLEATRFETSRQPARTSRQAAMTGKELYHTPGSKGGYRSTSSSSFASLGVV